MFKLIILLVLFLHLVANPKKRAASSTRSLHTPKKLSLAFDKVIFKLPLSAGTVEKTSSLRSKLLFVSASAGARHVQRAVISGAHSYDANDKKMLLTMPNASEAGDPEPKGSPANPYLSVVVSFCILTMV